MTASFGDIKLGQIRYGKERISQIYYGSSLIYDQPYVKFKIHFDNPLSINPRSKLGNRAKACGAEWLSTPDPQIWYVITPLYNHGVSTTDPLVGIAKLFCDPNENGLLLQSELGTCQILEITGDVDKIETMDRTFNKCTAITNIPDINFYDKFINSTKLVNVASICNNCTGISDGSSLYGYNIFSTYCLNITNHGNAFTDADTVSNLAQIPTSWGGTYAPPATQVTATKTTNAGWIVDTTDPNCPDFANITSLWLFTSSSISSFPNVNMKKSNIWNKANTFSTQNITTYYYPAFFQGTGSWPTKGAVTFTPTWIFAPDTYYNMLTASQTEGDMSGTLDYLVYGPLSRKYGSFDSTKTVYFGLLVLNDPADLATLDVASTGYAIHSNQYFLATITLNWFIPS